MPKCCFLILLGLVAAVPAGAAETYNLWYDENGQAVYSQFLPADQRPTQQVKPPPPPAEPPEVAQQRLQQQIQRMEDNREDQALGAEKASEARSKAEQAQRRCEDARKNLRVLNGRPRQLYKGSDGSIRRMDEEERQRQRAEMEKIIAKECK